MNSVSEDGRRIFHWTGGSAIVNHLLRQLQLKPKRVRVAKKRRARTSGTYEYVQDGVIYTIEIRDAGMSGYWIEVPEEVVRPIYKMFREAEEILSSKHEVREPEKPVLPAKTIKFLEETIFDFYRAIDELETTRGFGNVGIILTGLPGVGKTETMRWLREMCDKEWQRSYYQFSLAELTDCLSKGVPLNADRSMLFIDDIDANILRHREETRNPLTSQFLTCLDGLDKREGRVIVISTNEKIARIDPALTRAGRFEHVLHYEYPTLDLIKEFLDRRRINMDEHLFENWSFARIDLFLCKFRVAQHLHKTTLPVFYEKFIHDMGATDPTVEAFHNQEVSFE